MPSFVSFFMLLQLANTDFQIKYVYIFLSLQ